jgi:AMIN domain-containing protein
MRHFSLSHALTAGVLLLVAADARAEDPPLPASPSVASGTIAAASPTGVAKPIPRARRRTKPAAPVLAPGTPIATYPSFRLLDDGSTRVTLEVTHKVAVTEHKAKGRVVYTFAGAAVPASNTRLSLPTGFFTTPVERVEVVGRGDAADLIIELREAVEPTYRLLDTPRGSSVLQVDFPRPAAAAAPTPDAARRPVETKRLEPKAVTDD